MTLAPILVLHRYLGVVLGLVMTLWCLSGFVMMYQPFPATSESERLPGLARLDLNTCCDASAFSQASETLEIEMVAGEPVVRGREREAISLVTGKPIERLEEGAVRDVATRFALANGIGGAIATTERLRVDQWSVALWRREAPLWKIAFDDPARTFIYVSGKSARVVQDANGRERLLNWFGAIPHWLYPTLLRENAPLWTQIVIWAATLGTFLTITGLFVGITKARFGKKDLIPYRHPLWFVHHVLGLLVGVLILTWTFSGLLTMQPWGLFESKSSVTRADFTGALSAGDAARLLQSARGLEGDVVQLRAAPLLGAPYLIATLRDGRELRVGVTGPNPLTRQELAQAIEQSAGPFAQARVTTLAREDSYYYAHHTPVKLPVYRIDLADADRTHFYIDPATGAVLRVADGTAKRYRWLENGLHRLDFPILRARPLWDFVVLPLLLAVTIACATGAWLSFKRIGRDWAALRAPRSDKAGVGAEN